MRTLAWIAAVASLFACSSNDSNPGGGTDGGTEPDGGGRGGAGGAGATSGAAGNAGRGGASGASGAGGATGSGGAGGRAGEGGSAGTMGSGGASGASGATGAGGTGGIVTYGQKYSGGEFHEGPVDYEETEWHNACAPATKYAPVIRQAEGNLLAGLWNGVANVAGYCDACIYVETARGKTALLRVVTYGETTDNSIDVSPEAFQILNSGEYPRTMSWQFAKCPDTGRIMYEFQTGSSQWWTSLWVRNARVPITKVEVRSPNHANYVALTRGSDGTLTDAGGFGEGMFSIRLTGIDGQQVVDTFPWPAAGIAGQMLTGQGNFQ
jgi:expansin (peptidoglycan-binding protein)